MIFFIRSLVLLSLVLLSSCSSAQSYKLELIAEGFSRPLGIVNAADGSNRLFILEKSGRIFVLKDKQRLSEPFLDISSLVSTNSEQGLLGMAFHPRFAETGYFYLNYTNLAGNTVIARYRVSENPDNADANSQKILLSFSQPFPNHNGGHLAFGPDGYLYIGTGDGGDGGDPQQNGQNLANYLGKMLRIDVDRGDPYSIPADNPWANSPDAVKEIWAYGLRNPWRFSFDRATGDLYIADVGQRLYEELNVQAAGSSGGQNYGWRTMEGFTCFNPQNYSQPLDSCEQTKLTLPVLVYDHSEGVSITGGYVYRGSAIPELIGKYLFGDIRGSIWQTEPSEGTWTKSLLLKTELTIVSFGEDEAGELYLSDLNGGNIYKLSK